MGKSLLVIAQCRRIKELIVWMNGNDNIIQDDKYSSTSLPKLSRLIQLRVHSSIPIDLNHFSLILTAASNLVRLDLPFDCLLSLLEIKQINHLLYQRIKSNGYFKYH
ncbi:unnamed protein product [Adineta steineri]|uniref:Uncharacterized protein n=1 Tax=Adineta steineri TaxID=433720 RepID=A0A815B292_9BILA|nr:unnamed protein product [Adineta steineri]CAF1264662.1 unnamed protein product [Adineta steineri]CAF3722122.1 unnamed protein product [Adineta steineri]CAF3983516.1 unnamed protein product [Adineta steineri]